MKSCRNRVGGAHRDPAGTFEVLGKSIARNLSELADMKPSELIRERAAKFDSMGAFEEK